VFNAIFTLVLLSLGFAAGYIVRELLSRKRRAVAREAWLIKRDQKRYDDGVMGSSPPPYRQ